MTPKLIKHDSPAGPYWYHPDHPLCQDGQVLHEPPEPDIAGLIESVREWGLDRNITGPDGKATLLTQLSKTQEELTETRDAAMKWLLSEGDGPTYRKAMRDQVADGVGDQTVTLILAAELAGLRFEDCLAAAYGEIKGRTGRMVNGTFCKD